MATKTKATKTKAAKAAKVTKATKATQATGAELLQARYAEGLPPAVLQDYLNTCKWLNEQLMAMHVYGMSGSVLSDMLQLSNSVGALYSAAKEDDLGEEGDEEYDFVQGLVKELAEYGLSVDFDKLRARVEAEQKK
jgi:hypothetical protein